MKRDGCWTKRLARFEIEEARREWQIRILDLLVRAFNEGDPRALALARRRDRRSLARRGRVWWSN